MNAESHLQMAERHVLRSAQLLEAQAELVRSFERHGWDARRAHALLQTMRKSHHIMVAHRDALLQEADATALHKGSASLLEPKPLAASPPIDPSLKQQPADTETRPRTSMTSGDDPKPGPVDVEEVYVQYVYTCKQRGIKPLPRERARELIAGWTAVLDEAMRPRGRWLH